MKLVLELKNNDELRFIKKLLEKLRIKVVSEESPEPMKTDTTKAIALLEKIAGRGTLAKQILDPVAWQKEIRKDRKLPFRGS